MAAIIDGILLGVVGGIFYAISRTLGYIVQILLTVAYLTYLEGSASGQTVGKKAMGIRVVDFQTGGPIVAPPISYSLEGKQYIAVAAGGSILTFTLK